MSLRVQFVDLVHEGTMSVTALCEEFEVSRKTGYKWLKRFEEHGEEGLRSRSRAPRAIPHKSSPAVIEFVKEARLAHPNWGARKICQQAAKKAPHLDMPSETTVHSVLAGLGLVRKKRRRRLPGHPGKPAVVAKAPNEIWTTDFKGHFKMRNGKYCYPLTLMDEYSRYVLACQACDGTGHAESFKAFERVFREHGLPSTIKSDNGNPFATCGLNRLSKLSVWWIKLGIRPVLIEPSSPQQNGAHERMHRTMKEDATLPPKGSKATQQREFNRWRKAYNTDRPHEALGGDYPAEVYRPSSRELPDKLPEIEYPGHFEVRRVSTASNFRWNGRALTLTSTLQGEDIGLEEIGDGKWAIYFAWKRIGILDERKMKIIDEYGRPSRQKRKK